MLWGQDHKDDHVERKIVTYIEFELASPMTSVFYQHNHRKFLLNP
jgi:hypothetical protein